MDSSKPRAAPTKYIGIVFQPISLSARLFRNRPMNNGMSGMIVMCKKAFTGISEDHDRLLLPEHQSTRGTIGYQRILVQVCHELILLKLGGCLEVTSAFFFLFFFFGPRVLGVGRVPRYM